MGHNVRNFDYAMLKTEFLRMGRLAPQPKAIMDTLELVRRLRLPRPHNLGASANATAFVLRPPTPQQQTQQPRCCCSGGYRLNTHRPSVGRYLNWSDGSHTETVQRTHRNWAEAWKTSSRLTRWGKFERTEMSSFWPLDDIVGATFQKFRRTTRLTSVGCSPPAWIVRRRRSAKAPSNHER